VLQGKALTSAAQGESLRVLNLQSKTVIEAVAAGPGLAVVGRDAGALTTARLAVRP
jgi:flagella basal body P-ring formation protein FlgA